MLVGFGEKRCRKNLPLVNLRLTTSSPILKQFDYRPNKWQSVLLFGLALAGATLLTFFAFTLNRPVNVMGIQLTPNTNVWVGYAWINELPASGNPVFDENRIWQQVLWSKKVGQRKLFSRSRLEQRFVETGSDTGWRFRQFVKADRPLYEGSPVSLVAWDEVFIDLNETDFGQQGSFSQNRAFLGIGRKFSGPSSPQLEVGYLNQFLRRRSAGDRFNHILSVNWFLSF